MGCCPVKQMTSRLDGPQRIMELKMEDRWLSVDEIEGVARWGPLSEIEENDFNLNIARYVQKPFEEGTTTVEEVLKDFQNKLAALEQAEEELEALLIKEDFEV